MDEVVARLPFPIGLDTDNGGEFINYAMIALGRGGGHLLHPLPAV
jgi:hypothetical protein